MATLAEFAFEPDAFVLGSVFEALPDVQVELERVVPTQDTVAPYFWLRGAEREAVESTIETVFETVRVTVVDSIDRNHLLRATWPRPAADTILTAVADADVALVSAVGTADGWHFEVRGDTREAVGRFHSTLDAYEVDGHLAAIHSLAREWSTFGLTDPQRDAMLLAFERGYFDSPRRVTLEELSDALDISRQAFASRLRRGTNRLIRETLAR